MKRAALALLVVGVTLSAGIPRSGATFTATASNPGNSFIAAASFNTVAVSLIDPGTPLRGIVSLSATATSGRGMQSVTFQRAVNGSSSWTTLCTVTAAPYNCSLDTAAVADGLYDLRAVALDTAGYSNTRMVSARRFDNTGPTTALSDPGSPLTGSATLDATATDASGLASVTLQYRPSSGGSWAAICTRTSSPTSCAWNTASLADGLYDVQALATDALGNTAASTVTSRRVDNTAPAVALTNPGTPLAGAVTLQSTSGDGAGGSGVTSVRYEYKLSSGGTWTTACTSPGSPFSCSWTTTSVADGTYDLRAIATDGVGKTTTSLDVTGRVVDNTGPSSATLTDPGSPLSGTVTLSGAAADALSGIASVGFERSPAGADTWSTICTDTTTPYACAFDTTGVADALYDLRVVATDNAGNTRTSTVVANRRVDNNGPTVTLTNPGAVIRGIVTLSAGATDPVGVQSVSFDYRPAGTGTWTTACTDTTSPYTCPFATTLAADGSYDLRATATDTLGHVTNGATVVVVIDNQQMPVGTDVQGGNGGTARTLDSGDTLTFTWSEPIAPASLLAGWNGTTATSVLVHVNNNAGNDQIEIWKADNSAKLAFTNTSLQTRANWVGASGAVFNATMLQSGSSVTVTFGSLSSGAVNTGVNTTTAMTWRPSASATDLAGNAVSTTQVTESGAADVDF